MYKKLAISALTLAIGVTSLSTISYTNAQYHNNTPKLNKVLDSDNRTKTQPRITMVSSKVTTKKKTKKKSTKKVATINPYSKPSKTLKHRGIKVNGSIKLEQYIAQKMYEGKTTISLQAFQQAKKQVTFTEVYNNIINLNPALMGIVIVKVTNSGKYGIPDKVYVQYDLSPTQNNTRYSQLASKVDAIVKKVKTKKTTEEKYLYIYDTFAKNTRTNNSITNLTSNGTKNMTLANRSQYLKDKSIWGALYAKSANSLAISKAFKYVAEASGLQSSIVTAKFKGSYQYLNTFEYKGNYIVATDVTKGILTTGIPYFAYAMSLSQLGILGYTDIQTNKPIQYLPSTKEYYQYKGYSATSASSIANKIRVTRQANPSITRFTFFLNANDPDLEKLREALFYYLNGNSKEARNYSAVTINTYTPNYVIISVTPAIPKPPEPKPDPEPKPNPEPTPDPSQDQEPISDNELPPID